MWRPPERPMPGLVGGGSVQFDSRHATGAADRVARHVQVDRQDPAAANQEVVREDGIDPADAPAPAADQAIPHLDPDAIVALAHAADIPSATAMLTAPASMVTSSGTLPNGSPSRWIRVCVSPSMRTVRACTISTFGFLRCLA